MAGNGVVGSVEARSTEGYFTLFRVLKKYTSRTAHTHSFFCLFLTHLFPNAKKNQGQKVTDVCLTLFSFLSVKINLTSPENLVFVDLQLFNFE